MRKLKLQMQCSIDGFVCGPNGEMNLLNFDWSDDIKQYIAELSTSIDTILLGKNLATGFIPHWTASYQSNEPLEGAEMFVKTPKVVFTKTMENSIWENTQLAKGELKQEVLSLKSKPGADMIVYGGVTFVSSLLKENLIDELHLFINPTAIGQGQSVFRLLTENKSYQLKGSKTFNCGIVVLSYQL